MKTEMSSREFRDEIVGKRIIGVVARPGRAGQPPVVLMLHFDDGSVVEFVSPRSDRLLKRAVGQSAVAADAMGGLESAQLELMPLAQPGLGAHGPN
jgi:hypothetical protein